MTKDVLKSTTFYNGGYPKDYVSLQDLEEFFDLNVCIPRGENRHPYADVLHEWIEGADMERYDEQDSAWISTISANMFHAVKCRIKPKDPVYEYKVKMMYSDGKWEYTNRYFTQEEYESFGFPKTCMLEDDTKRIRK